MKKICLIAALDEHNGIGKNNELLCYLPADLSYFKKMTMGKPIIMGRKTYESIGRPLPGRDNIVISRFLKSQSGITVVNSFNAAMQISQPYPEVFIIGGSQLFQEAIGIATHLYITRIHHKFAADCYFPAFALKEWFCVRQEHLMKDEKNHYDITFEVYQRIT